MLPRPNLKYMHHARPKVLYCITLGLNARPKVLYFSGSVAIFAQGLKSYNVANFALTSDRPQGSVSKYLIYLLNLFNLRPNY